ncbi:YvrJ family protein [Alteribacter keqinensis]|uniref:YvrJ family protein n=1 Tax=Alteribacter keqinensis TaxID=2483800 RepID=A0A3M7TRK4_9BACI|nr:YvrJ family protein [Alteribacter keqinensis]RNA67660.1 YvrJ family protein [Alteribacter keqinensis]
METIPDWAIIAGNVGFPVLVAFYLLTRFEKRIENLTRAIENLQSRMKQ